MSTAAIDCNMCVEEIGSRAAASHEEEPRAGLAALSDEALVARAQAGSLPAFADLVRRFEGRVFNFILRRAGGRPRHAEAEDLTQETFLRAWQSLQRYRPAYRFSTWLFTIATRVTIDHLRSRAAIRAGELDGSDSGAVAGDRRRQHVAADNPLDRAIADERSSPLWDLAGRLLSDEQHSALWLRYAEDLPVADIARALGRTQVSARVLLFRARQLLARHIPEEMIMGEQR